MLEGNGWCIQDAKGLRSYCLAQPGEGRDRGTFIQGVFTRHGGVSRGPWAGLNVGRAVGDDPKAVEINHCRICKALDISQESLTTAEQVHGRHVASVKLEGRGSVFPATDGLVTDVPGVTLVLRFADCVPLLFFDPRRPAVGLAHAGWRGTLAGIAGRTVRHMQATFGSRPEELVVGIGPSIGPCCYEVGPDLANQVRARFPQWPDLVRRATAPFQVGSPGNRPHFDLWRANRRQLEAAGVHCIAVAQHCTACHTDEFFSHRAACLDQSVSPGRAPRGGGRTGRFAAVIGLREA
jgi:YfiH family protein